jgi:hypothetical protein
VVATAAHTGWLAWAGYAGRARPNPGLEGRETPPAMEADVDVEPPQATAARAVDTPPDERPAARSSGGVEGRGDSTGPARTAPAESGSSGAFDAPPLPSTETADRGTWAFAARTDGALGSSVLSGAPDAGVGLRDVLAQGDKPGTPGKGVLPPFTAHDAELGLVPGGQFVSMARDRVRRSRAPTVSHGSFEFRTDAGGVVISVRCLEASSGRPEWDEVATQLVADAHAAQPVRVPEGARGVVVVVDVDSSLKTVTGGAPNRGTVAKVVGAISDPVDTIIDSQTPPQHVVAAHVADVHTF